MKSHVSLSVELGSKVAVVDRWYVFLTATAIPSIPLIFFFLSWQATWVRNSCYKHVSCGDRGSWGSLWDWDPLLGYCRWCSYSQRSWRNPPGCWWFVWFLKIFSNSWLWSICAWKWVLMNIIKKAICYLLKTLTAGVLLNKGFVLTI